MTQSPYTNTLIFQKRRVESMEKYEIEELKQLLWKLENEIRETTASLHNINKS
ncbi:DegQ family regulator, partial [Bacillus safensis]|uniref:DegQ family regulator n=1 Tax=Bacillus safensis TaxID=561879 RepID=UPI003AA913C5